MKILIPIIAFGRSGGFRVISKLATEWKSMGHDVYFLNSVDSDAPYFPTTASIIYVDSRGNKCVNDDSIKLPMLKRLIGITCFLHRNSREYDVIMATHNITAFPVRFACRTGRFYYIQAYEPEFYNKKCFRDYVLKTLAIITYHLRFTKIVNADIYKNYKDLHSDYVVPPGMDLEMYHPKEQQWDGKSPITVGCIGRTEAVSYTHLRAHET